MLNQSRKIMTGQPEDRLWAVVDAVRFASRDNPVTEIKFRSCRGGELMESSLSLEEIEEDTNLPVIVGGTNASGKTSLLRGIRRDLRPLAKSDHHANGFKEMQKQT